MTSGQKRPNLRNETVSVLIPGSVQGHPKHHAHVKGHVFILYLLFIKSNVLKKALPNITPRLYLENNLLQSIVVVVFIDF